MIKLTDKEKKVLSFLDNRYKFNGKFKKEDINELQKYVRVSEKEINLMLRKFLKNKLITEIKWAESIGYYLAGDVPKELIDNNILRVRNFIIFKIHRHSI